MKKDEFIKQLAEELKTLSHEERQEILNDQEEFIREAIASGRNEEEVVKSLGTPKSFADSLKLEVQVKKIEEAPDLFSKGKETLKTTWVLFALMPLNIFLILVPGITVLSFLFSWLTVGSVFAIGGVALICFTFFSLFLGFTVLQFFAFLFLSIGFISMGTATLALLYKVLELSFNLFLQYVQWNLRLIKGEKI